MTIIDLSSGLSQPDRFTSSPLPLCRPLPKPEPYPLDALGPILRNAAEAIKRRTQAPVAMCGQSVLAAVNLVTQALADIEALNKVPKPSSCYFLTVAESGDGKTSVDDLALIPIKRHQRTLYRQYERDSEQAAAEKAVYERERLTIVNGTGTSEEKLRKLSAQHAPVPPLQPTFLVSEPTLEGLILSFQNGHPAQGLFSSEGGQFIGGYGMSAEHRLKTAAALSGLWDGNPISRCRRGDGTSLLYGRRLAVHLMAQPAVSRKLLSDPMLHDQGILSRFLLCQPESLAGTRFLVGQHDDNAQEHEMSLRKYYARVDALLEEDCQVGEGTENELTPRVLSCTPLALSLLEGFHDHLERQLGKGKDLAQIKPFASKGPEHALRLAATLEEFENPGAQTISDERVESVLPLVHYHITEALRLHCVASIDEELNQAQVILDWLHSRGHEQISLVDLYKLGPPFVRSKKTAIRMLSILEEHHWIAKLEGGTEVNGIFRRDVWQVRRLAPV